MHEIGNSERNMNTAKACQRRSNIHIRHARHKNNKAISIGQIGIPNGKNIRKTVLCKDSCFHAFALLKYLKELIVK